MNELDFSADYYKELCERMSEILTREKELKAEKDFVREKLLEQSGGARMENGIKISFVEGRKSVDYKGIVTDLEIPGFTVNAYTKTSDGYWKVTKY